MRFGRPLFNLQMLALGWRYSAGLVREFFSLRCVLVWPIHRWLSRLAPVVLRNVRILAPPHSSLTPVLTNGNALPAGELILLTHGR